MEKLTILVIDDDVVNIQIISEILSDEYIVKIAKDGESGYAAYEKYSPSIIISDINMPNQDGIKMVEKIRQTDHNTKVILITAYSDIDYLQESTSLKLTKYIYKPIEKEVLLEAVEKAKSELDAYEVVHTKDTSENI